MKKTLLLTIGALMAMTVIAGAQSYTFSSDLSLGSSGSDVSALQTWLISNGYDIPAVSSNPGLKGYFGAQTQSALIAYQKAQGLPAFGFFGSMTRQKINSSGFVNTSGAPTINRVNAPTTLTVGQSGTWTVDATDPHNSQLNYSIDWGDVVYAQNAYAPINIGVPSVTQTSTFTHTYSLAGTYTVTVTVTNTAGLTTKTSSTVVVTGSATPNSLTLVTPHGGEMLTKGTTYNITWIYSGYSKATNVSLRLLPVTTCTGTCPMIVLTPYSIAENVPISHGTFSWVVGDVTSFYNNGTVQFPPDGQYSLQICDTSSGVCNTGSLPFTLTSAASGNLPDINVITPNGGEQWQAGSNQTVQVSISGDPTKIGSTVTLYLVDSQNRPTLLSTNTINSVGTQTFNIAVPTTMVGSYKLYATLSRYSQIQAYDYSDYPLYIYSYINQCPVGYTCTTNVPTTSVVGH